MQTLTHVNTPEKGTNVLIPARMAQDRGLTASAKVLYGWLQLHNGARVTQETLAEELGLSDRQVRRLLRKLRRAGYIGGGR